MSEYTVSITIQTDNKVWDIGRFSTGGWVRDHALAEGTYVELENTGATCRVEAPHSESKAAWLAVGEVDEEVGDALPFCQFDLNRTGRNLVLLAVSGPKQVFHHWEGESCAGQGARCEVAEPPESSPGYSLKAVFYRAPKPGAYAQPLDSVRKNRVSSRIIDPPRK